MKACLPPDTPLDMYEEIKFEPPMVEELNPEAALVQQAQLGNGDILIYQRAVSVEEASSGQYKFPTAADFLTYIATRRMVKFRPLPGSASDPASHSQAGAANQQQQQQQQQPSQQQQPGSQPPQPPSSQQQDHQQQQQQQQVSPAGGGHSSGGAASEGGAASGEFQLELVKDDSYDTVTEGVARHLGVMDPRLIRLTQQHFNTHMPLRQPLRYRQMATLEAIVTQQGHAVDTVYYEVVDIPLPELELLKTLQVGRGDHEGPWA
jgi:hypothetical protein